MSVATEDIVAARTAQRRRMLDEFIARAQDDALRLGRSISCNQRLRMEGPDHRPCRASTDVLFGVTCLCPCHDEIVAVQGSPTTDQ